MKEGDHCAFDPNIVATAIKPSITGVDTLPVVSPTREHAYWKRVGAAPDQLV